MKMGILWRPLFLYLFHRPPLALAGGFLLVFVFVGFVVVVFWVWVFVFLFCKCKEVCFVSSTRVLDDRQCFTARSARHKKKAAVVSLVQSLLEGRTDCPISGVFGAGKTLSTAAMIADLLVMDPTLKIMIVIKENVAAHAFAKHFLRLELSDSINSLVGRLVGYVELQKGPANKTDLDVHPAFRNDVLRSKQVLIGCGGGFHQECSQPYSPVKLD